MKNSNNKGIIIGFSGKLLAGKDLSALLVQHSFTSGIELDQFLRSDVSDKYRERMSGFKSVAFADKLKSMAAIATGTEVEMWHDREWKEQPLPFPFENYTSRTFMTTFGKALREQDKDFFAKATFADYKYTTGTEGMFGVEPQKIGPNWLITDVRYPNEVDIIHQHGGIVIRVERSLEDRHGYEALEDVQKEDPELYSKLMHDSETALDNHSFIHTVTWKNELEELQDKLLKLISNINVYERV